MRYVSCACLLGISFAALSLQSQGRKPAPVPSEVLRELLLEIAHDMPDSDAEPQHGERNFFVDWIDLNGDKEPELSVEVHDPYWCSPAGNCTTWVYRKAALRYVRLLKVESIQHLEVQRSATNGFQDIVAAQHASAVESDLYLYKFDGVQYRLAECSNRLYPWDGEAGALPKITQKNCPKRK